MSSSKRGKLKVWFDVWMWQPEAELSAGKIKHTADRTRKRRCRWEETKESYHAEENLHVNLFLSLCRLASLSSLAHSQMCKSLPHSCVCLLLVSYFLHISLLSPPPPSSVSVAAVLVMAVCPWCKLAVGSQVAHMTVIDVQVFKSSHTETLEPHTHTQKHNTHACTLM